MPQKFRFIYSGILLVCSLGSVLLSFIFRNEFEPPFLFAFFVCLPLFTLFICFAAYRHFRNELASAQLSAFDAKRGLETEITLRKKITSQLDSKNTSLLQAQKIAHIGYWTLDLITQEEIWTDTLYEIYGLPTSTKPSFDAFCSCIHPDDKERLIASQNEKIEKGESFSSQYRFLHKDGSIRHVIANGQMKYDENEKPVQIFGLIQDVTDLKEAEIRLAQSKEEVDRINTNLERTIEKRTMSLKEAKEEADAANSAKTDFLASMSHEIRTPLNGILGIAQLLEDSPLDVDQKNKLNVLLSSSQNLLSLVNDILDMSKIESGLMEVENKAFDFQEMLKVTTASFVTLAKDKNLYFKIRTELQIPEMMCSDELRIRQILNNLLSNALKFTEKGGITLSISWRADKAKLDQPTSQMGQSLLSIIVEDTGAGIAEERLPFIFDEFTQADSSISRKFGGTGLGLSIITKLTELMGGSIEATSTFGQGSIFTVSLPVQQMEIQAIDVPPSSTDIQEERPPTMKILVAEDNMVNAMIILAFLEKFGHRGTHVENGAQAVQALQQDHYDLVLMDIHMPEMDGLEATKCIREMEKGKAATPIVGLTAEAFSDRLTIFRDTGMDDVLTKPYKAEHLKSAIAKYATHHSVSVKTGID